eukprot:CAMPEP_0194033732 /NCGR_PEP_ID=MMETSP0009_2-20130614/6297_1 /TAXON_ID=210454 /ORGANISM="Grammatophora oceanica, Strain CCMP 410" /LENGTH=123 /DNA_ID=CAMNT_0038674451 /DNA_START=14 /DNA_END=382 /DNA_ORIENTATION=-
MMHLSRLLKTPLVIRTASHVLRPQHINVRVGARRFLSSEQTENAAQLHVVVEKSTADRTGTTGDPPSKDKELLKACGTIEDDDEEEEQEEMFVDADPNLGLAREWGGPRRGGRFPEPTRFGDW